MDRKRAIEFGASAAIHVVLLAGLSVVLLSPPKPPPPPAPMDVTIADDVGLVATAPQNLTSPAQSQAPELGKPEDAAPAAPAPEPQPVPAKPKPAEVAPAPKPAEITKPLPKKPAPTPPQPAKPQTRPAPSSALAGVVGRSGGTTPGSTARTTRGSTLGGIMKGVGATPNNSKSATPQGATMSAAAAMDIGQKIKQQVQPCANRQTNPGPGAERIRVTIRLRINRDGTLSARPMIEGHDGVDGDNARYQRQVDDRAIATFMGCQPLRGLPAELYDVPNGWSNFLLRYKLPG
ncbi:cell envelope biogenesis protein TolA [Sphingomonas panacisoli]|uniref:Cell envelope biogenesis protein TolA n=1 Tax=Sphingomonas panacisoli TaxID=1813879 RepID=A0A5B8LM85_9SPHN|nr:cell envelope biogenesis protein TolA [Sphingomonas panacisoli]